MKDYDSKYLCGSRDDDLYIQNFIISKFEPIKLEKRTFSLSELIQFLMKDFEGKYGVLDTVEECQDWLFEHNTLSELYYESYLKDIHEADDLGKGCYTPFTQEGLGDYTYQVFLFGILLFLEEILIREVGDDWQQRDQSIKIDARVVDMIKALKR